jgi:uncharacterized protein YcaQ
MASRRASLRLSEARRIALAAQRFGKPAPSRVGRAAVLSTVRGLGLVQIDSVNVLVRSHYLPAFSRLGSYDRSWLDALAYRRPRNLFEYWGHEASLLPVETYPLLRWRMRRAREGRGMWSSLAAFGNERPAEVARLREAIAASGPMSASDFESSRGSGGWWGWSDVKRGLEYLFWTGVITTASRRSSFERVYDLTERVLPATVYNAPEVAEADAQRELVRIALGAFGVATEADLRDYFRLAPLETRERIAELVESGDALPIAVEGWKQPAYLNPRQTIPRRVSASALLSPFDALIWHRPRTTRLFNFDYRLEIYTPSHKRVHGYYVLPYLLNEELVARVDLKADRAAGTLLVQAAHYEQTADRATVAPQLRTDLEALAAWLGLAETKFPRRAARNASQ